MKTIKSVMKEFNKKFVSTNGFAKYVDIYDEDVDELKSFIRSSICEILDEMMMKKLFIPQLTPFQTKDEYIDDNEALRRKGYNKAIYEIKERIKEVKK